MKSKKVTMLAAALVVAVVALAGIGYATTYTATTTNTANEAKATYITVVQNGTAKYDDASWLTKVYFNTVNTETGNTYTLIKEWGITNDVISKQETGNTLALISVPLKLSITKVNSADTALDVSVTTSQLAPVAGLSYVMVLGTYDQDPDTGVVTITKIGNVATVDSDSASTTWNFANVPATGTTLDLDVLMFISGGDSITASPGERAGFTNPCSFEFTITASE